MKATITIEIQGSKKEIDEVTHTIQSYIKHRPHSFNIQGWKGKQYPKRIW